VSTQHTHTHTPTHTDILPGEHGLVGSPSTLPFHGSEWRGVEGKYIPRGVIGAEILKLDALPVTNQY